jgi:hypothetical protein
MADALYDLAYCYSLRSEARKRVVDSLNKKIREAGNKVAWDNLTICSINKKAIDFARLEWPKFYSEDTHLGLEISWKRLLYKFLNNPAYFDLAGWQNVDGIDVLQGLALGSVEIQDSQIS